MVEGHYICDICHQMIRPQQQGKTTGQIVVKYKEKFWKDDKGHIHTFYTKAHKKCVDLLKKNKR